MNFTEFVNHFISLLVICNPLSALPAVLRITRQMSIEEKRQTGLTTATAVGAILLIITWIGTPLLKVLGIQISSFQIAGGLVLLLMSLSMLQAEESPIKATVEEQKEKRSTSGAIVPLAIPIIAGPGSISSVIVSVSEFPGLLNQTFLSISAVLVAFTMGLILYFANNLEKFFGQSGINIINRLGGLILASISIQSMTSGFATIFPGLMHK